MCQGYKEIFACPKATHEELTITWCQAEILRVRKIFIRMREEHVKGNSFRGLVDLEPDSPLRKVCQVLTPENIRRICILGPCTLCDQASRMQGFLVESTSILNANWEKWSTRWPLRPDYPTWHDVVEGKCQFALKGWAPEQTEQTEQA
ncbi:hypothetical protein QBC32DRAFT_74774 [Pseudoneurospora amorphoporcata]|uniref:Uncharacterized protein n=1 Tax=Pseudoneurospora amorphoporcata TaxID=241081 RepID=A0AAN6NZ71_9PEZI|nr:hypothetical protein QBC32DRAFT_74774 [Pseudoneurospora amorphoporcata]